MISNFFQSRFEKNIKFLTKKDNLQQDYEFLYEGLNLQEIFLTEIAIFLSSFAIKSPSHNYFRIYEFY